MLTTSPLAGGGAYYFAKRSINADKKARHEADTRQRQAILAASSTTIPPHPPKQKKRKALDHTGNPSAEASDDPAPTQHAPEPEGLQVQEKSKYEAKVPYRSKKGDRFS